MDQAAGAVILRKIREIRKALAQSEMIVNAAVYKRQKQPDVIVISDTEEEQSPVDDVIVISDTEEPALTGKAYLEAELGAYKC